MLFLLATSLKSSCDLNSLSAKKLYLTSVLPALTDTINWRNTLWHGYIGSQSMDLYTFYFFKNCAADLLQTIPRWQERLFAGNEFHCNLIANKEIFNSILLFTHTIFAGEGSQVVGNVTSCLKPCTQCKLKKIFFALMYKSLRSFSISLNENGLHQQYVVTQWNHLR
jgi:hypothetical protein